MKTFPSMKLLVLSFVLLGTATAQTTVEFWHTFGDPRRGNWIQARADEFNKANPTIKVVPSAKGSDNELITSFVLSARQGKAPALAQIFEGGSQLALDSGLF